MCPDDADVVEPRDHRGSDELDIAAAYDRHAPALLRFARAATADPAAAEDVVQEAFLRAWRSRERYAARRGTERAWLFAIARNVVIDGYRSGARRPVPVSAEDLGAAADREPGAAGPSPAESVEHRVVLLAALAQLSPEHRQVVTAVQVQGLSYGEVSQRTGIPVPTLRTRMYYALRGLRGLLEEEGGGA